MPRYVTSVLTPWPDDRAFEYLADLEHFVDWDPGVSSSVQVDGAGPGLGASFDVTVASIGPDLVLRYNTVAFDAPRRLEVRAESAFLVSVDVMTFEPTDHEGCIVTYDADLRLKGLLALGNPVLGLVFSRIGARAASGLRQALDGTAV